MLVITRPLETLGTGLGISSSQVTLEEGVVDLLPRDGGYCWAQKYSSWGGWMDQKKVALRVCEVMLVSKRFQRPDSQNKNGKNFVSASEGYENTHGDSMLKQHRAQNLQVNFGGLRRFGTAHEQQTARNGSERYGAQQYLT